nr:hypothetical protein [Tanacetum cinerariifolium]
MHKRTQNLWQSVANEMDVLRHANKKLRMSIKEYRLVKSRRERYCALTPSGVRSDSDGQRQRHVGRKRRRSYSAKTRDHIPRENMQSKKGNPKARRVPRRVKPTNGNTDNVDMEKRQTHSERIQQAICNLVSINYTNAMDMRKSTFTMGNGSPDANNTTDVHISTEFDTTSAHIVNKDFV